MLLHLEHFQSSGPGTKPRMGLGSLHFLQLSRQSKLEKLHLRHSQSWASAFFCRFYRDLERDRDPRLCLCYGSRGKDGGDTCIIMLCREGNWDLISPEILCRRFGGWYGCTYTSGGFDSISRQ